MAKQPQKRVTVKQKEAVLPGGRCKEADFLLRRFAAVVPAGHTIKDVKSPNYFQFYYGLFYKARQFGPVKLEIISEDCSLHLECLVIEATQSNVHLRIYQVHRGGSEPTTVVDDKPLIEQATSNDNVYTMKWTKRESWRILQHGKVVAQFIQSKDMCEEILNGLNDGTLTLDKIDKEYVQRVS